MAICDKRNWKKLQKNLESPENCIIFVLEKETNKNTTIMDTIFTTLFILFFGAITIIIFIQTNVELWNEIGKDFWNDMKSNITDWFDNTKMSMWYKNKKNKVEILSNREYKNLMESGRIKNTIIVM